MAILEEYMTMAVTYIPPVIGALLVLLIGWIVGRLLGRIVRILLDKIADTSMVKSIGLMGTAEKAGITLGYIGDILVRLIVYLIAILAAVDILNMEYLSALMTRVVFYIPHVVAFALILVAGFILVDYFLDFLQKFHGTSGVELITPVLFVFRIFLYFVIIIMALSQLMLDLTIIYTLVTPVAWGIGLGLGAAIAIMVGFGLKDRAPALMDKLLGQFLK
ncbi:MAG: Conserved helix repeat-containing protein [Methanomicrobiales archaeon]|nr:Conserved helix repeat-containing protein [Methanomicrobiales archaeon]MDD1639228.1 hypothetical protein [Methanomicrobiales archaeon]MDD1645363.1 hypothetical protein [Methanomicrobiales archaeon]MDD1646246.1 hypothetical protein [Methanomicrobiales archaeon]